MATNMNRVMISVPADIKKRVERLKKLRYYDKPYAEIYRQLIQLGLEYLNSEAENGDDEIASRKPNISGL